ncbi:MAG: hypothetical protein IPN16_02125 [Gemmatimonadetes bacterium]|nr:hypothetical protein [Gemmatimonadota bacterium]
MSEATYTVTAFTWSGFRSLPQFGIPLANTPSTMVLWISDSVPPWIQASSVRLGPIMPPPSGRWHDAQLVV